MLARPLQSLPPLVAAVLLVAAFCAEFLVDSPLATAISRAIILVGLIFVLRANREDMGWAWPAMAALVAAGAGYYLYEAACLLPL